MDSISLLVGVIAGIIVGGIIAWLAGRSSSAMVRGRLNVKEDEVKALNDRINLMNVRIDEQNAKLNEEAGKVAAAESRAARMREIEELSTGFQKELAQAKSDNAVLQKEIDKEREAVREQLKFVEEMKKRLEDTFKALSADALKSNNESFLKLAKTSLETFHNQAKGDLTEKQKAIETLIQPLRENLDKTQKLMSDIDKDRSGQYTSLADQVKALIASEKCLQNETSKLVTALSAPKVRGNWGELTLRRAAELSGMVKHCDFDEQTSVESEGGRLRPDMIINMPSGRKIVVDAKAPLKAYLEAVEATSDDERKSKLTQFSGHVKLRVQELSRKEYWSQFSEAPDFVVLFLPGEQFLGPALDEDPALLESAFRQNIILATPATLISLLKAVEYGWRQEALAENAKQISELGGQLYDRIATMVTHFQGVGNNLDRSVDAFNSAMGSLERRVLVSARKLKDLGTTSAEDLPSIEPVDTQARKILPIGGDVVEPEDGPPALA